MSEASANDDAETARQQADEANEAARETEGIASTDTSDERLQAYADAAKYAADEANRAAQRATQAAEETANAKTTDEKIAAARRASAAAQDAANAAAWAEIWRQLAEERVEDRPSGGTPRGETGTDETQPMQECQRTLEERCADRTFLVDQALKQLCTEIARRRAGCADDRRIRPSEGGEGGCLPVSEFDPPLQCDPQVAEINPEGGLGCPSPSGSQDLAVVGCDPTVAASEHGCPDLIGPGILGPAAPPPA
jgi:hypothetical protein